LGQDSLLFLDVLTEGLKVFLDLALEAPPLGFSPRIRVFSSGFAPSQLASRSALEFVGLFTQVGSELIGLDAGLGQHFCGFAFERRQRDIHLTTPCT